MFSKVDVREFREYAELRWQTARICIIVRGNFDVGRIRRQSGWEVRLRVRFRVVGRCSQAHTAAAIASCRSDDTWESEVEGDVGWLRSGRNDRGGGVLRGGLGMDAP